MMGFGMGFGFLFFLLIIVVLVVGLTRGFGQGSMGHSMGMPRTPGPNTTTTEDPKRLLQLRYARGEITREEYLQMLADLEGKTSA